MNKLIEPELILLSMRGDIIFCPLLLSLPSTKTEPFSVGMSGGRGSTHPYLCKSYIAVSQKKVSQFQIGGHITCFRLKYSVFTKKN